MSTQSTLSRIARTQTNLPNVRPAIMLFAIGIVADAATTVYGISIMGLVYEGGPLASEIIPWLWRTHAFGLSLGEAAGLYSFGYVLVGLSVAGAVNYLVTDSDFNQNRVSRRLARWFPRALAAVFILSPVINLYQIAKWIAYVPNAGWV